jgi:putative copper export protein
VPSWLNLRLLYEIAIWLHILAATIWVGGIAFLVLVVVPWLRGVDRGLGAELISVTGRRFRLIAWICFAVFAVTGTFGLWMRGVRLSSFAETEWLRSDFGRIVITKLSLFALIVLLSLVHDFFVGPAATAAMQQDASSPRADKLRRRASLLGRVTALAALAIVFVAVLLVRGLPV